MSGDKYVLEEMQRVGRNAWRRTIGAHSVSRWRGHYWRRPAYGAASPGDHGALGKKLAELVSDLKVFPQTIRNVRVREKVPFAKIPAVRAAIDSAERELDGNGRVVVRYSGTEAFARVMVEAESKEQMDRIAASIAERDPGGAGT